MAGVKGRSGTNKGQDKPWRDALMLAVNEIDESDPKKAKKLRKIAQAVVDAAAAGDMQAAREIGDRLDGKPRQEIDAVHDVSDPMKELLGALDGRTRGLPTGS